MFGSSALPSRLMFAFVLVCAAVMSFVMCSDAARARPMTTQVNRNVLRRLNTQRIQHHPLFTGLSSLHAGANGGTEMSWNHRETSPATDHQSNPLRFTEGRFSYNQNSPNNRPSRAGTTRVRPASSYNPHSVIIRKSSHKETAGPFHQRSSPPQVWDPKDAQKSNIKEQTVPRNDFPSPFSSQTDRYWSSQPTLRGLYGGNTETNGLTVAGTRTTSSGIQSSKFFGPASQTAPHAPSISNGVDASLIKRIPSPEKPTSSVTDFSHGLHSVSGNETPGRKKVHSYLFKDTQASFGGHEVAHTAASVFSTTPHEQRASDAQAYSWFSPNVKQLQQSQKDPTPEVQHLSENAIPLYLNANVAQYGVQADGFTKYQHTSRIPAHSALGKDATGGSFVSVPHADSQGNYATGGSKSVVSVFGGTTTGAPTHAPTPGKAIKRIYGFRGFEKPAIRAVKQPSILSSRDSNGRTNSQRYSFDKAKDYKITNKYPMSPKYGFRQREASTPAKLERTSTDYTTPSRTLDIVHTNTTPRPSKAWPLLPESDAGMDSSPDRRRFRISKRIYGLKGFGTQPLEGAKTLVGEPDKSARDQQGFENFKPRSSHIWQPKSSHVHTTSRSEDLKPLLETEGSTGSASSVIPGRYKKSRKMYTFLGFLPVQNRTGNANNKARKLNPSSHKITSVYQRSAGKLTAESSPKTEPRTEPRPRTQFVAQKASQLNGPTSSTVRGRRVKGNSEKPRESTPTIDTGNAAIVRLPKQPTRVVAVTYADILGSVSFSGVTDTTQTPITPADKDYFPTTTVITEQKEVAAHWMSISEDDVLNKSRGPDAVEGNTLGEGVDRDVKSSSVYLENEGSGSEVFDVSDVLSKSRGLREDLPELDYLRMSSGNSSVKSVTRSHTET